jgi:LAS superfamily LD-carboxypeptidase LdcB
MEKKEQSTSQKEQSAHIKLQTVDTRINCLTQLNAQHPLQEIPNLNKYLDFACS